MFKTTFSSRSIFTLPKGTTSNLHFFVNRVSSLALRAIVRRTMHSKLQHIVLRTIVRRTLLRSFIGVLLLFFVAKINALKFLFFLKKKCYKIRFTPQEGPLLQNVNKHNFQVKKFLNGLPFCLLRRQLPCFCQKWGLYCFILVLFLQLMLFNIVFIIMVLRCKNTFLCTFCLQNVYKCIFVQPQSSCGSMKSNQQKPVHFMK